MLLKADDTGNMTENSDSNVDAYDVVLNFLVDRSIRWARDVNRQTCRGFEAKDVLNRCVSIIHRSRIASISASVSAVCGIVPLKKKHTLLLNSIHDYSLLDR